jgi:hypothetical protein
MAQQAKRTRQRPNEDEPKPKTQDTSDINLATFIQEVKNIESAGHYFKGKQLWIRFDITQEDMQNYSHEYINSIHARCDATRRNFLRLLK